MRIHTPTHAFMAGFLSALLLVLVAHGCQQQSETATRIHGGSPCYALAFNDNDSQHQDYDLASDEYFLEYQDQVDLESSDSTGRDFQDGPIFLESQYVDEHDIIEQQELDRAKRHYELIHGDENSYQ